MKEFGGLDGAFNNAGIVGAMGPLSDMTNGNWNDVISVNLTGAFMAAKAQIPAMKKQGQGSIVFTSSFVGFSNGGMPGMGAYAASKAGLIGLVQSLASDHAIDGIRVNALLRGGTITPSGGEGNPAALEFVANLHPMKRMATAKEIAQAAPLPAFRSVELHDRKPNDRGWRYVCTADIATVHTPCEWLS